MANDPGRVNSGADAAVGLLWSFDGDTDKDLLKPVTGDLRRGGKFELDGDEHGQILVCDPRRLLTVTWLYSPEPTSGLGPARCGCASPPGRQEAPSSNSSIQHSSKNPCSRRTHPPRPDTRSICGTTRRTASRNPYRRACVILLGSPCQLNRMTDNRRISEAPNHEAQSANCPGHHGGDRNRAMVARVAGTAAGQASQR